MEHYRRQSLDAALQLLATEPAHRRLSDFLPQLQDRELVAALAPYAGGALGHLLDTANARESGSLP
jgi:hypothetical protein